MNVIYNVSEKQDLRIFWKGLMKFSETVINSSFISTSFKTKLSFGIWQLIKFFLRPDTFLDKKLNFFVIRLSVLNKMDIQLIS